MATFWFGNGREPKEVIDQPLFQTYMQGVGNGAIIACFIDAKGDVAATSMQIRPTPFRGAHRFNTTNVGPCLSDAAVKALADPKQRVGVLGWALAEFHGKLFHHLGDDHLRTTQPDALPFYFSACSCLGVELVAQTDMEAGVQLCVPQSDEIQFIVWVTRPNDTQVVLEFSSGDVEAKPMNILANPGSIN